MLGRFHRESTSSFIDATFQGDYFEALAKLRTAIAARAAPAMSHVVGEVVPYLAEAGVLEPLDGYDGASTLDLLPGVAQSKSYVDGDKRPLVAVPFNRSTPIMYLNMAMLERAGVAPPTDWDELSRRGEEAHRAAQGDDTSRLGLRVPGIVVVLGGARRRRRAASWSTTTGDHARGRCRRARSRPLADDGASRSRHAAAARARLQRLANRDAGFPGRAARRCFGRAPHFCATSKRTRDSRSARRPCPATSGARCRPAERSSSCSAAPGLPRRRPPGSSCGGWRSRSKRSSGPRAPGTCR